MPGRTFPSRYSSEAPPPVLICDILSAKPSCFTAAALSPPPIMVVHLPYTSASACATAIVPLASVGFSKTPIGPFQTTALAPATFSAYSLRVFSPISIPIMSAGL